MVAIITEWPTQYNRKVLISTRIDCVSEIIRQRFNLNFEKSNIIKLNLDI